MSAISEAEALLHRARALAQAGHYVDADVAFQRVLEREPDRLEALNYLAQRALLGGRVPQAVAMLERATRKETHSEELWRNLGMARLALGDADAAAAALTRAIEVDATAFRARLFLGQIHERAGRVREAAMQYFGAIVAAQNRGLWRDEQTTPAPMRERVTSAMAFVERHRGAAFAESLEPLREKHGAAALARVTAGMKIYLGEMPANYPDPRQLPVFLYIPQLPAPPWFERDLFPWYSTLEAGTEAIREELLEVLRGGQDVLPFLGTNSLDQVGKLLAGGDTPPAWDAFFFYNQGKRYEENCARCPRTAETLDSLPLVRIREHAPEICFSVLAPGTHILPHRGVTNARVVTHLPLIVPEQCALVVGGDKREWHEGRCFTFDDTFEHEAYNRSASTRAILLMDCWNPYLTEVEREAITVLVGTIGDFNRVAGIHR